uniref:Uncharacterized protein n=1 Tax=Megaselia scalaris TaxID=36166 RepID=T1GSS2_MEGSC
MNCLRSTNINKEIRAKPRDQGKCKVNCACKESLTPLDREKRKLPDAHFAAKNAVLGFVFNKVDNLLDSKTRFVEALDRSNIEKNKEYNITAPVPIRDFQSLITAVVSPKIQSGAVS